jgi:hypothetical protein
VQYYCPTARAPTKRYSVEAVILYVLELGYNSLYYVSLTRRACRADTAVAGLKPPAAAAACAPTGESARVFAGGTQTTTAVPVSFSGTNSTRGALRWARISDTVAWPPDGFQFLPFQPLPRPELTSDDCGERALVGPPWTASARFGCAVRRCSGDGSYCHGATHWSSVDRLPCEWTLSVAIKGGLLHQAIGCSISLRLVLSLAARTTAGSTIRMPRPPHMRLAPDVLDCSVPDSVCSCSAAATRTVAPLQVLPVPVGASALLVQLQLVHASASSATTRHAQLRVNRVFPSRCRSAIRSRPANSFFFTESGLNPQRRFFFFFFF